MIEEDFIVTVGEVIERGEGRGEVEGASGELMENKDELVKLVHVKEVLVMGILTDKGIRDLVVNEVVVSGDVEV